MLDFIPNDYNTLRDKRFSAHNFIVSKCDLAESDLIGMVKGSTVFHNRAAAYDALEHVQSSGRSVPSLGRPAFCMENCAEKRRNALIALVVDWLSLQSWGIVSHQKGRKICLRKLGSSQQPHHLLSQVVWKPNSSAALRVLRWAQLLQMQQVLTRLLVRLLAVLLACCATTRAFAAVHAKTFAASSGRTSHRNRRRGCAPAAIFCFKEPSHV